MQSKYLAGLEENTNQMSLKGLFLWLYFSSQGLKTCALIAQAQHAILPSSSVFH